MDTFLSLAIWILDAINPHVPMIILDGPWVGLFIICPLVWLPFTAIPMFEKYVREEHGWPSSLGFMVASIVIIVVLGFIGPLMIPLLAILSGSTGILVSLVLSTIVRLLCGIFLVLGLIPSFESRHAPIFKALPYMMTVFFVGLVVYSLLTDHPGLYLREAWKGTTQLSLVYNIVLATLVLLFALRGVSRFFARFEFHLDAMFRVGVELLLMFSVFVSVCVKVEDLLGPIHVLYLSALPAGLLVGVVVKRAEI